MDNDQSAVSWSAIAAGATATAGLTLILIAVGSALGFSSVSPWPNSGLSATTFRISTGLYFVFTALIASTIGGYVAGRLRTKWTGLHTYEIQFRDTAHGFLAWAFANVVGAAFLATAAAGLAGGAATGLAAGAGVSGGQATNNSSADYYVTLLQRPPAGGPSSTGAESAPAAAPSEAPQQNNGAPARQMRLIITHAIANGGAPPDADRAYLAQLVSRQTGLSQADADKRVADVTMQVKAALDQGRRVAASISIWTAIAMLVGAFCAALAAIEGGQLRDRRWRGVFWTRAYNEPIGS